MPDATPENAPSGGERKSSGLDALGPRDMDTITRSQWNPKPLDPPRTPKQEPVGWREDWRPLAACRGKPVELFYPDNGGAFYDAARVICSGCPVRVACLEDAIASDEVYHGMRGGLTPTARQRARQKVRFGGMRPSSCRVCGAGFTGNGTAMYCSAACRNRAARGAA